METDISSHETDGSREIIVKFAGWEAAFRNFDEDDHILRQMNESRTFYESDLLQWLFQNTRPRSRVVDVGACIGTFSIFCARVLKSAVIAIEPDEANLGELRFNIERNELGSNIHVLGTALGEVPGRASIEQTISRNCGAKRVTKIENENEICGAVDVQTLDNVLRGETVSCIKVDVEGAELQVLIGGKEIIGRCRPTLIVECGDDARFFQVERFVSQWGYHFHRRFCVTPTYVFIPNSSHAPA